MQAFNLVENTERTVSIRKLSSTNSTTSMPPKKKFKSNHDLMHKRWARAEYCKEAEKISAMLELSIEQPKKKWYNSVMGKHRNAYVKQRRALKSGAKLSTEREYADSLTVIASFMFEKVKNLETDKKYETMYQAAIQRGKKDLLDKVKRTLDSIYVQIGENIQTVNKKLPLNMVKQGSVSIEHTNLILTINLNSQDVMVPTRKAGHSTHLFHTKRVLAVVLLLVLMYEALVRNEQRYFRFLYYEFLQTMDALEIESGTNYEDLIYSQWRLIRNALDIDIDEFMPIEARSKYLIFGDVSLKLKKSNDTDFHETLYFWNKYASLLPRFYLNRDKIIGIGDKVKEILIFESSAAIEEAVQILEKDDRHD